MSVLLVTSISILREGSTLGKPIPFMAPYILAAAPARAVDYRPGPFTGPNTGFNLLRLTAVVWMVLFCCWLASLGWVTRMGALYALATIGLCIATTVLLCARKKLSNTWIVFALFALQLPCVLVNELLSRSNTSAGDANIGAGVAVLLLPFLLGGIASFFLMMLSLSNK